MKIARVINVLAVLLLIGAAVSVYRIKYQATWQAVEIERLQRQIAREKSDIKLLEAEYSHLVRPDRIQSLAEKHLDLKLPDPRTYITTLAALPMRPQRVDSIADTIASLTVEAPIMDQAAPTPGDDPIGRTIEAMGLAVPSEDDRIERMMQDLGLSHGGLR